MLSRAMRGFEERPDGHHGNDQVVMIGIQTETPSCTSNPSNEPSSFCFQFEDRSPTESPPNSASSLGEEPPASNQVETQAKPRPVQWFVPILFGWDREWTEQRWMEFTGKKVIPQPETLHSNEEATSGYMISIPIGRSSGMEKVMKEESHKRFIIESCYKSASRSSTHGLKY